MFKFIIDRNLMFVYSVDLTKNNDECFLIRVVDSSSNNLMYKFSKEIFSYENIYKDINYVISLESSSWKEVFNDLVSKFRNSNLSWLSCQVVNSGLGRYWFTVTYDYCKYTFNLEDYSENSYIFTVSTTKNKNTDKFILYRKLSNQDVLNYVRDFVIKLHQGISIKQEVAESSKFKEDEIEIKRNILSKAFNDFDELLYSDKIMHTLNKYEQDGLINLVLVHRLFLCLQDLSDKFIYTREYRSESGVFGLGFSLDDDSFIYCLKDDDGEFIAIDNEVNCIYFGNLDLCDIDILIRSIYQSGFDYDYWLNELDDYDFSKDFWFSYDSIHSILEDALSEFNEFNELSEGTYEILVGLCNAKNSKVVIKDLDRLNKVLEYNSSYNKLSSGSIDTDDLLTSLGNISSKFQI